MFHRTGAIDFGAGDMSGNVTSEVIELGTAGHLSATLHAASATHVGTIAVDTTDTPAVAASWHAETLPTTPAAVSGSAFDTRIEISTAAAYARIRYVFGSGVGTLSGNYTLKESGGGFFATLATIAARLLSTGSVSAANLLESIRKAVSPTLGTVVYRTVSGTSAETAALAVGTYEIKCDVACWYRVNAAASGDAAVANTAPAVLLCAGEVVQVPVTASGVIVAITSTGATGYLGYRAVT